MKKKKEKIFVWIEVIQSICTFLLTLTKAFEGFACSVQNIWAKRQKTSIRFLMTPIAIIEITVQTCKYLLSLKSDVEEYLPKLCGVMKGKSEKRACGSNKKRKTVRVKEPYSIINGVRSKSGSKKCSTAAGIGAGLAVAGSYKGRRNNK